MRFKVTVNGNNYDVLVEEVNENAPQLELPSAPMPINKAQSISSSKTGAGTKLNSPLPGVVIDVKVSVGQTVKLHDVVIILEAMKMENEIFAPVAGKITSILVTKGSTIESGDVLLTIE